MVRTQRFFLYPITSLPGTVGKESLPRRKVSFWSGKRDRKRDGVTLVPSWKEQLDKAGSNPQGEIE